MDVSYSAWLHEREESLVLEGDSFSFLFDRRYTNRLNRMSRVFFEAYALATKEIEEEEDRFPSLSEIDARMESGAVYAFKDRLMKNTEFFEEVKISGVSYLVPRAIRFVDATGTYTDLAFDFEEGTADLPSRRKTPAPPEAEISAKAKETLESDRASEVEEGGAVEVDGATPEEEEEEKTQEAPAGYGPDEGAADGGTGEEWPKAAYEAPEGQEGQEESEEAEGNASEAAGGPGSGEEEEEEEEEEPPQVPFAKAKVVETMPPAKGRPAAVKIGIAAVAILAVAALLALTSPEIFTGLFHQGPAGSVQYSAYLSNSSEGTFLGLEVENAGGMANEMEMVLPPDSDRRISAKGGGVTISHSEGTQIGLTSRADAGVRVYLTEDWTSLPVTFNILVPDGYDSGLVVHGEDYAVQRNKETIVLRCNVTSEKLSFEQSYNYI